MRTKLNDSVAACNMIRSTRIYARKMKKKSVLVPLEIDDMRLKLRTYVIYNPFTKVYSITGHGIGYKKVDIYPSTNQKLKCTSQHAIDRLNANRERSVNYRFLNVQNKNL